MKYCYRCGQAMGDDFAFCPSCGTALPSAHGPVRLAEPSRPVPAGARVMAGLSKGLGIAALVLSIISSFLLVFSVEDLFYGENPDNTSAIFSMLVVTALFSVPALLLSIFARKQGAVASRGRIFGMIGCTVCVLLLIVGLLNL